MSTEVRKLLSSSQRKWAPAPDLSIKEEGEVDNVTNATSRNVHHRHLFTNDDEENIEYSCRRGSFDEELGEDDDDYDDDEENRDDVAENIDSDYSSSPSILDENINFDLVYTLHSFRATIDGQATVKKGDALTLLDDSNSYWWLIRDLKTSEVGYIPAENIETPFERLARLNKYRNAEIPPVEQLVGKATHSAGNTPSRKSRKVLLSTSVNIQLQIIIVGDNGEEVEDEVYEEWQEEIRSEGETESTIENHVNKDNVTTANTASVEEYIDEVPAVEKSAAIGTRSALPAEEKGKLVSQKQCNSDEQRIQKSKVIRLYAGNIDVIGAAYHSMRIYEDTNVEQLLADALDRFHISELEKKKHAGVLSSIHRRSAKNSGVEYYVTVKIRDGDEMTLDLQDKPFAIHESLTDHLTTPMPPLSRVSTFPAIPSAKLVKRSMETKHNPAAANIPVVQFFMHKRIRQIDARSGQVHVRVLLSTPTSNLAANRGAVINKAFRRFTKGHTSGNEKKRIKQVERIEKMLAVPAHYTIQQLTSTALVKFHILSEATQQHNYELLLYINNEARLLDRAEIVADILKPHAAAYFELRHDASNERPSLHINSTTIRSSGSILLESPRYGTGPSSNNKVFPEFTQQKTVVPVMTSLDERTENIIKRVDNKLMDYRPSIALPSPTKKSAIYSNPNPNFRSPMSISWNEHGIDIHLPHGLLRSTTLNDKEQISMQYTLMKYPDIEVYQSTIIPDDALNRINVGINHIEKYVKGSKNTSLTADLIALVTYGSHYLNASETAYKSHGALNHLTIVDEDKSLSSLEDLRKELQRIVIAHQAD